MEYFISVVRDHYINFEGRARRKEYWMFTLFSGIFSLVTFFVDFSLHSESDFSYRLSFLFVDYLLGLVLGLK